MVTGGIAEKPSTQAASSAAPVGVVSSPAAGPVTIGTLAARSEQCAWPGPEPAASPCDVSTVPEPTATGVASSEVDAERVQPGARADDVDDRVDRADLVEVHVVDGRPVHGGLGVGESAERSQRPVDHGQRAASAASTDARISAHVRE